MSSFVITNALEQRGGYIRIIAGKVIGKRIGAAKGGAIEDVISQSPYTRQYNRKTLEMLARVGNDPVRSMLLLRSPLPAAMADGINAIANGQWVEISKKYGYDHFYHLCILVNGSVIIEKNAYGINVGGYEPYDAESLQIETYRLQSIQSINSMLQKTEEWMGPNYFAYSAFHNNCQGFIYALLQANNLAISNDTVDFVYQPLDELIKELPAYVEPVVETAAKLYGLQTLYGFEE